MLKFGGRFDGENQSLVIYVVPVDNKWFVYLSKQEISVELQFLGMMDLKFDRTELNCRWSFKQLLSPPYIFIYILQKLEYKPSLYVFYCHILFCIVDDSWRERKRERKAHMKWGGAELAVVSDRYIVNMF